MILSQFELGLELDEMKKSHAIMRGFFVFKAPPLGLISNQVYEGFTKHYELRAFLDIDG